ncbi:MAG: hypothetical protein AAF514_19780, partial [Verrucomicrobiota bacterium]
RLQPNWFHQFMRQPQRFHPGTIMPGFWPGGKGVRPSILEGDPGGQIDALWQYLKRGREARTPAGIRREPIPLLAGPDEAVMLRRAYKGIGKRGIGVGYPGRINLSFDAARLRLGSIWSGDFGEMSGVWRGQGAGTVNERSREITRFPEGVAYAVLENREAAWPEEAGMEIRFRGYRLDRKRRPTFRYQIGGLSVEDGFLNETHEGSVSLVRSLTFDRLPPMGLTLRLAAGKEVGDRSGPVFRVGPHLQITAVGAFLRGEGESRQLLLPLTEEEMVIRYKPVEDNQ